VRVPAGRRVFTDQTVDGLAEEVGVPRVPAVLPDQVAEQPAQTGMGAVGRGDVDELIGSALGQAASSFERDRSTALSQTS
jgi:hypothetical protein